MLTIFFSIIGIFFWLAIEVFSVLFVIALDICTFLVEFIISAICGVAVAPVSARRPVVTNKQVKRSPAKLSARQQKTIEKQHKREIDRAKADLEYDMLMMMEVCADD